MRTLRRGILLLAVTLSLAACTPTVTLQPPPPDANNPLCAEAMVRLPAALDGAKRNWTDSQSTGAWGTPTAVIFSCGVTPPGPSPLPCQSIQGVDWIIDDSTAPRYRVTSYGRTPAVQLYIDTNAETGVSSATVLDKISPLLRSFPVSAKCS